MNLHQHTIKIECPKCHRSFKYEGSFKSHTCCHCDSCGRTFCHPNKFASHTCIPTVECLVCHRKMPVITNTHLEKHGLTPGRYAQMYGSEFKTKEILERHSRWMKDNNPNLLPGVKEKQSLNNAMRNPLHKRTQTLAVNDPEGQLQRHLARKKRAIDSNYTSTSERWLADYLEVPSENRRFWVYGAGEVDIAFPDLRVAIEVQGCYWHGCLGCGYTQPGNKGQRERDLKKAANLKSLGWVLMVVWEHEITPYLEKRTRCA